ncbi:MAG: class I SAM-dependent methyltransferase [Nanoarchaeota archaeon]|nr:class I SAM-dependent methyltransferase [Nanoarchaeota archaeon]
MENVSDFKDKEYNKKYKKALISQSHVVFPAILSELGEINGKRVLDLGCGSGDFSSMLSGKGAKVDGADISDTWIEMAKEDHKEDPNLNFFVADSSDINMIGDNQYDVVIMNMVFLNISSKEKVEKTFEEVSRILKLGGDFIFTDLHPLCKMTPDTLTGHQELLEGFSYFKDGSNFKSKVKPLDNPSSIDFFNKHWTIETYTKLINDFGMHIYRIIEPFPIEDAPEMYNDYKVPEYIIFHCKKD